MHNVREQALLSGLVFTDRAGSQGDEEPQWQETKWPPFPPSRFLNHAPLIVNHPSAPSEQTVVVFGLLWSGMTSETLTFTSSIVFWNTDNGEKAWRQGPTTNQLRVHTAAVVCNGALYTIGGTTCISCNDSSLLDTIERIPVKDFLSLSSTGSKDEKQWRTLECRLTSPRYACAAAVVRDRFIIVAGGNNKFPVATVDILDTSSERVLSGPPLNVAQYDFGMAVVGQTVYVVGGKGRYLKSLTSVEYLQLDDWLKEGPQSGQSLSPVTNSWKVHKDLVLGHPRSDHAVVVLGSCLVVVGGDKGQESDEVCMVEVLDTQRNRVWNLDTQRNRVWNLPERTRSCRAVAVSTGIATMARSNVVRDWVCTLPLVDKNSACFARLLAFGGSTASLKAQCHG